MSIAKEQVHPWSLTYIGLKTGVVALRQLTKTLAAKDIKLQKEAIPERVELQRTQIPSHAPGRTITVDVYQAQSSESGPRPVHINFHGSGFIIPGLGGDTYFCANLAAETNAIVLDCDYRKAPESPFPAASNDANDVYSYIKSKPDLYDLGAVTVGGFSAGANLAMSLAVNLGPEAIRAVISFYGNPDISKPTPPGPETKPAHGVNVPAPVRTFFYRAYILPGQDRTDLRLSPGRATADRWPEKVFITCGAGDSLYYPSQELAQSLKAQGKNVEWIPVEVGAHSFDKDRHNMPQQLRQRVDDVYEKAFEAVREVHKARL